jgi:hypothetical protein
VADHQDQFDFASDEAKDIVADRERSWSSFTQAVVWGTGVVVALLLALLLFVV